MCVYFNGWDPKHCGQAAFQIPNLGHPVSLQEASMEHKVLLRKVKIGPFPCTHEKHFVPAHRSLWILAITFLSPYYLRLLETTHIL